MGALGGPRRTLGDDSGRVGGFQRLGLAVAAGGRSEKKCEISGKFLDSDPREELNYRLVVERFPASVFAAVVVKMLVWDG